MAGLDGIENKIHPGDAMDKDLYDLPPAEAAAIPQVCGSLREALEALDGDREFLKKGNVFDDDQIDAYIELKMEEVERLQLHPPPVEFDMYYKVLYRADARLRPMGMHRRSTARGKPTSATLATMAQSVTTSTMRSISLLGMSTNPRASAAFPGRTPRPTTSPITKAQADTGAARGRAKAG